MMEGLVLEMQDAGVEHQERRHVLDKLAEFATGFEFKLNKQLKGANYSKYEAITNPQVIAFNKARDTVPKEDTLGLPAHAFLVFDPETFRTSVLEIVSNPDLSFNEQIDRIQKAMVSLFALLITDFKEDFSTFENSEIATNALKFLVSMQKGLYKKQGLAGSGDVDLEHVKVQAGFDFITDSSVKSMESVGISDKVTSEILLALGKRMRGFEGELNKRMKGLTSEEIKALKSPFPQEAPSTDKIKQ